MLEVIYKSERDESVNSKELKDGGLYGAKKVIRSDGTTRYHIKFDEGKEGFFRIENFINLSELEIRCCAQRGILLDTVSVGGGKGARIAVFLPEGSKPATEQRYTSPVVMAKEIAHNWVLFRTSSGQYYIGHYSEN